MVDIGFFEDIAIFRAVDNFMFQFGIHGNPNISQHWSNSNIQDDPRKGISNDLGTITFAKSNAPNSRSCQMFINLRNNAFLDGQGFTPFGKVVEGMDVVKKINTEYGENAQDVQPRFQSQGNAFILKRYPNLDIIKSVTLVSDKSSASESSNNQAGEKSDN
jgi:peptidyl-prolyl cis-trans isomerase A (cyclophilin A)